MQRGISADTEMELLYIILLLSSSPLRYGLKTHFAHAEVTGLLSWHWHICARHILIVSVQGSKICLFCLSPWSHNTYRKVIVVIGTFRCQIQRVRDIQGYVAFHRRKEYLFTLVMSEVLYLGRICYVLTHPWVAIIRVLTGLVFRWLNQKKRRQNALFHVLRLFNNDIEGSTACSIPEYASLKFLCPRAPRMALKLFPTHISNFCSAAYGRAGMAGKLSHWTFYQNNSYLWQMAYTSRCKVHLNQIRKGFPLRNSLLTLVHKLFLRLR